jgi:hypothetical protein
MSRNVPALLRRLIRDRAGGKCEYCLRHEDDSAVPHQPDHIVSRKHGGRTDADNLAWACAVCNLLKGPETAAIDPSTGRAARLFDPRRDFWADHFRLRDGRIEGTTPEGRVTELLLQFNRDDLVELRNTLVASGRYP